MKISFFSLTEYVTDVDYSYVPGVPRIEPVIDEETGEIITPEVPEVPELGRPDCIAVFDIDFDRSKVYRLKKTKSKYELIVEDLPIVIPPETTEEKHKRIFNLITTSESLEGLDLEGETFSDFEIGEIIMARVFGGNPHAESAFNAKILSMLMSGEQNIELIQKAQQIKDNINMIRNLFNLGNL